MSDSQRQFDTIFISHALPEDNVFVSWLASRLELMGYKVWCEIKEQKGGEDFWLDIENIIRNKAAKFLAVMSNYSVNPEKRGVRNEIAVAAQIRDRGNFIIPLKVDEVPFHAFPIELTRLNAVDFNNNWAKGLYQLAQSLEKDDVPTSKTSPSNISETILRTQYNPLLRRDERYWTNWIPFQIPEKIYIHLKCAPDSGQ